MRKTPLEKAIADKTGRNARYEAKRREAGQTRISVWVPHDKAGDLKAYAARLCEEGESEDTPGPDARQRSGEGPPPFQRPEKGKHPKPDELAFMHWHFARFPTSEAVERITAETGRAQSMILKHKARWTKGDS